MKKIKNLLFIIAVLFICCITMNVKAAGYVVVGIEENGTATCMGDPSLCNRYSMENGVLTLTDMDGEYFVLNYAKSDVTIRTTTNINFVSFTVPENKTVTLETTNNVDLGNPTINGTLNINNSKNVTVSTFNGQGHTNINNSEVSIGVIANTDFTANNSTLNMTSSIGHTPKSYNINNSTINGTGVWFQSYAEKNYITDSKINLGTLYFVSGPVYIDNSEFNISDTISSSMPFEMKNSKLYFEKYFQLTSNDAYIENSEITSGVTSGKRQWLIASPNFYIKDSQVDIYSIQLNCSGSSKLENTKINIADADVIFLDDLIDSELTVRGGYNTQFDNIKNSKLDFVGDSTVYLKDIDDSEVSIDLTAPIQFINSNITNSTVNIKINQVLSGGIDEINNSEMFIDGNSGVLFAVHWGDIIKSHIVIQNEIAEAVYGYEDILSTNDIVALDEDGKFLSLVQDENGIYRFLKNGEGSKYVEICSKIDVLVHVVNGTWEDGTTDDKIIDGYYGIKLSNLELPVNMKANEGYENGTWDIKIDDSKIYDDIELTYTFYKKGEEVPEPKEINSDDEDAEEEIEVEIENPKTGSIIEIIKVISIALILLGLSYKLKIKVCK